MHPILEEIAGRSARRRGQGERGPGTHVRRGVTSYKVQALAAWSKTNVTRVQGARRVVVFDNRCHSLQYCYTMLPRLMARGGHGRGSAWQIHGQLAASHAYSVARRPP